MVVVGSCKRQRGGAEERGFGEEEAGRFSGLWEGGEEMVEELCGFVEGERKRMAGEREVGRGEKEGM